MFSKIISTFSILIFAHSLNANELKLAPFVTDGCTMFIDGTNTAPELWRHCCIEHDLRYWFGGSEKERDEADMRLKSCVENLAGPNWAKLIYTGIRLGHYSPIKHKYHWSWAWSVKRDNVPLTKEEEIYVIGELQKLTVEKVNMEEFIKLNFSQKAL